MRLKNNAKQKNNLLIIEKNMFQGIIWIFPRQLNFIINKSTELIAVLRYNIFFVTIIQKFLKFLQILW